MKNRRLTPPPFALWIVRTFSRSEDNFSVLGDMEEEFFLRSQEMGLCRAKWWFRFQVLQSLPRFLRNSLVWSFVMFKNYFIVALRNVKKQKGYSFINIAGLAVGMAVCILILLVVRDEFSYDRFHEKADRLYRVIRVDNRDTDQRRIALTQAPLADALKQTFPEIEEAATFNYSGGSIRISDEYFPGIRISLTDPSFFRMFSFDFLRGDPDTALNDPHSVVITEEESEKFFGPKDPLGKVLEFRGLVDLKVTGVFRKPRHSHIELGLIMSKELYREAGVDIQTWQRFNYTTYVLLRKNVRPEDVNSKLFTFLDSIFSADTRMALELQPLKRIYLHSGFDYDVMIRTSDIRLSVILSIIAIFILVIACVNFLNLATARSEKRMREVGLRKVVGASRSQLIRQFLSESVFLAFLAAAVAVILVEFSLPFFNNLLQKDMTLFGTMSPGMIFSLCAIAMITGLAAGVYPAFVLSSLQPVCTVQGKPKKGRNFLRRLLVVSQFAVSLILVILTVVVYKQLHYMQHKKLGYDKENLVCISLDQENKGRYSALKNSFLSMPQVENVAAAMNLPNWQGPSYNLENWEGKESDSSIQMHHGYVDYDYFETYKMEIIQGRGFSKEFSADKRTSLIVNEEAVRRMGMEDPIGKQLDTLDGPGRIIGVVKDFHFDNLRNKISPMLFQLEPANTRFVIVRIQPGNIQRTINSLEKRWKEVVSNQPFRYAFLDDVLNLIYIFEITIGKTILFFSGLAVFIACMGLFGLASYTAEQRTKEIGIRKVLGATIPNIMAILSQEFSKRVVLAGLIACPLAYLGAGMILSHYAYRTSLDVLIFLLPVVGAFILAFFTVSFQSVKAALSRPVDSLRHE
ncbi:MAG: ABC transporter permease [Candidatus Aminicenantes bacterium]|nr:ABC transporter permease [Candidatus Aminicenantes bacterium]